MKLSESMIGNVMQIDLEGRFDANTSEEVEQFVKKKIDEGNSKFVLNMEKVPFIASAGLRVILVFARKLRQDMKGDLRVACLQQNVQKVFEISGLDNFLRIFGDVETALKSYEG